MIADQRHGCRVGLGARGFSLVELLVAVLLLSITIGVLAPVFTSGFDGVFTSGNKSTALFTAQEQIENEVTAAPAVSDVLVLDFQGTDISIEGEEITETVQYKDGRTVTITYFLPSRSQ